MQTLHNPDRYMIDLRQIMPQGRKRIGLLIGASAPTSHNPMAGFTGYVLEKLTKDDRAIVNGIVDGLKKKPGNGVAPPRISRHP